MKLDLARIKAHADDRLAEVAPEGGSRIASFKRLLKLETDRLRMRHRFGLGGRDITLGRSYLVDLVVSRACQLAAEDLGPMAQRPLAGCAVLAVGGYGRRELAPCSDVDLLVLRPGRTSPVLREFVEKLLPMLWDVGLEIGHSFRSVTECLAMAREDLHARNAMADARLITGSAELFHRFQAEMQAAIYGNARANEVFLRLMRSELQERLTRHGEAVCMQEPNVKEGAGGLRDVHTVGWIGHSLLGCSDLGRLYDLSHISASEHTRVRQAYDFISRARNEAHFQTGRRTDVLSLELQPSVAEGLGYQPNGGLEPSELFMRDYYRAAQELRHFAESFLLRTGVLDPPVPLLSFLKRPRVLGNGGRYELRRGELYARASAPDFANSGSELLRVFELAQEEGLPLSDELKHAIRAQLRLIDSACRSSREAAERFLALLARAGRVGAAMRALHETGFLGRYIPAFQRISLLVQHDHYHRYTVDEHTLRAVEVVDGLAGPVQQAAPAPLPAGESPVDLLQRALGEVRDHRRLILGILLHDIGKGRGGGHEGRGARIARRLCERLGLEPAAVADVVFLVQKHLVMAQVSQRRDLSDPVVLEGFAETVGTLDRLNMLFVLTYADISAVGPGAWSSWKAALLTKLYQRARADLTVGAVPVSEYDRRVRREEKVVARLMPEYLRRDVDGFLAALPERYLRAMPSELIARHFRLVHTLGSRPLLTDWGTTDHGRHTQLSACLRDSPGLLATLAGTLTGAGFDILAVEAFTRSDGIVLDVFTLSDARAPDEGHEARRAAVDAELLAALAGEHAVDAAVAKRWAELPWGRKRRRPSPPVIRFEAPDALGRTVIEVRADDLPGLVYRITDCLSRIGLNISFAKIATEKNRALDIFYVTRTNGEPLGVADTPAVQDALLEALTQGWPAMG